MDIQSAFEAKFSMPLSGRNHLVVLFSAVVSVCLVAAPLFFLAR